MNEEKNRIARLRRLNVIAAMKAVKQPVTLQYLHATLCSPYWDLAERKRNNMHNQKLGEVRETCTHSLIRRDVAFLEQQRWLTREEILHRRVGDMQPVKLMLCKLRSVDGKKL